MALTRRSNIPDIRRLSARLRRELPLIIANKAKNHYIEGFRRGGGKTDKSLGGWQARERADRQAVNRAILVKSADLWRDLDIRRTSINEIVLGTGSETADYSSVHNDGGRSGRGAGFQMPQREFLGKSRALDAKINTLIKNKMRRTYG